MSALFTIRVLIATMAFVSIVLLIERYVVHSNNWTSRTKDFWYALLAFSIFSIETSIESIITHQTLGYRVIFLGVAMIATLVGLLKRGSWGSDK